MALTGEFNAQLSDSRQGINVAIQFEGRLHNRAELEARFGALSIENLLLSAYRQWGENLVAHIDGEFTFVIVDVENKKLFAARDPLGIKPFYYFQVDTEIFWSSDITALARHPRFQREANTEGLLSVFLNDWSDQSTTFYKKLMRLPPGTKLIFGGNGGDNSHGNDRLKIETYWDFSPKGEIRYKSTAEYADHFENLLLNAVKKRVMNEKGVGIFLSAGVDSSSIAYATREAVTSPFQLETFSLRFEDPTASDRGFIDKIIKCGGWPHHDFYPDTKSLEDLDEDDRPEFADLYYVPGFFVFKPMLHTAKARGLRVIFTGDGGDEVFTPGSAYLSDVFGSGRFREFFSELNYGAVSAKEKWRATFDGVIKPRVPINVIRQARKFIHRRGPPWLDQAALKRSGILDRTAEKYREDRMKWNQRTKFSDAHRSSRYTRLFSWGGYSRSFEQQDLLARRFDLEFSYPLFDLEIIDFAFRIPIEMLQWQGRSKILLREFLKGRAPEAVCDAPKFQDLTSVARTAFFRQQDYMNRHLNLKKLRQLGLFNDARLNQALQNAKARGDHDFLLMFTNIEKWLKTL